jgi:hypothetical protein
MGLTAYDTVHYEGFIPILAEGWKVHESEIQQLQKEVLALKAKLSAHGLS